MYKRQTLYRLNNQDYTFEKLDIILDNSIVEGKTFSASHKFVCDIYSYVANTTFTFQANGEVCIVSTSSEHDSGNYACENDVYHPSFASSEGVIGTYVVNNNKLTIKVNGETFVFLITNVLDASEIISLETTINSDEQDVYKRQGGNNETTMQVMYGRNIYNLYYIEPGIVVFIPLNEMKMSYNCLLYTSLQHRLLKMHIIRQPH